MAIDPIRVTGLREFQRSLKQLDSSLPKALRLALKKASEIVVDDARPKVPRTAKPGPKGHAAGIAAASIKAQATQTTARVSAGGTKAPWFPWIDFGGKRRGRGGGIAVRQFRKKGRFVWLSLGKRHDDIVKALNTALVGVAEQAGLEVTKTNGE